MKWKARFRVPLLSICCLASIQLASAADSEQLTYPTPCYVEKAKVAELMVRMNNTVQILNQEDEYLQCREPLKVVQVDVDTVEMCSEDRIGRIQRDLVQVTSGLIKLAIRLQEPTEEQVRSLDLKKFQLFYDLKALRVFFGPSPCDSSSIVMYPFELLVDHVEWNLDQILSLFQTKRPARPPPPPTPPTPPTMPKSTIYDMLSPGKSFQELVQMARSNPTAMSAAIPQIVFQRYNGRDLAFSSVLDFVESLPTTENQVLGSLAIHDDMKRHSKMPDVPELVRLARTMERLSKSTSEGNLTGTAAWSRLTDLAHELGPLVIIGEKAECHIRNFAYQTELFTHMHNGSYPRPAYVFNLTSSMNTFQIYPLVKENKLVFRIQHQVNASDYPLHASDTFANEFYPSELEHQLKSTERFVLLRSMTMIPGIPEIAWTFEPVDKKTNQFRMLSSGTGDFMFAHESDKAFSKWRYRRVLLGKKGHTVQDHIPNADVWTLNCIPGNYTINP